MVSGRRSLHENTYVGRRGVPLQIRLDRLVLLVEERQIRNEILDDIGVRQGVYLHLGVVLSWDTAQAREGVGAVDVHRAASANTLAARPAEGQGRVDLVLDADQGVENHRTGLVQVEGVRLHLGLLCRVLGVPPVDLEVLHLGLVARGCVARLGAIGQVGIALIVGSFLGLIGYRSEASKLS